MGYSVVLRHPERNVDLVGQVKGMKCFILIFLVSLLG